MKFYYTAPLLMMLGVTRADVLATFSKGKQWLGPQRLPSDATCTDLHGQESNVDNYDCVKGVAGSKSVSFTKVNKDRTMCLIKFMDDNCDTQPYPQDLIFGEEDTPCQPVSGMPDYWESYKIAPHNCSDPTLGEWFKDLF